MPGGWLLTLRGIGSHLTSRSGRCANLPIITVYGHECAENITVDHRAAEAALGRDGWLRVRDR